MKRAICLTLAALVLLGLTGCDPADDASAHETPTPLGYEKYKNHGTSPQDKEWTVQEVEDLFAGKNLPASWTIADCVVADDRAYNRAGIVLIADSDKNTSILAFLDEIGSYQRCDIEAPPCEDSQLTYLGDGVVTFRAEGQDGPYTCQVTLSIADGDVNFTVEDIPDTANDI